MKTQRFVPSYLLLAYLLVLGLGPTSAWAANKDMVQLQTQVQQLQEQMSRMQQTFDERMGVMKNLVEQNTDAVNKISAAITTLQTSLEKQQADSGGHVDQISGQIQALNDTMDELKGRLAKVSKQLEDMQASQQNLSSQPSAPGGQPGQPPAPQAPTPDVLYNNALRDYNGGKNDLAIQEFSDYIKFYPDTDLAGNSYFYIAEVQYKTGDYQRAVANYDLVLQNFPSGNKAAAAQLKKGYALLELGKEDEGTQELKHVIQRYPRTNEATQARERLRKLAPAPRSR